MSELSNRTIAVIATDGFEDSELTSPLEAVKAAGATVKVEGKNGTTVDVDMTTEQAKGENFDGIILPGGTGNADAIRMDDNAVAIVKAHVEADKPLGAICHAAWLLTEADVLKGRTITSFPSLKTDLTNAGADWVDEEVVCDQGLVSSRTPKDLPAFNEKIIEEFAEGEH